MRLFEIRIDAAASTLMLLSPTREHAIRYAISMFKPIGRKEMQCKELTPRPGASTLLVRHSIHDYWVK